MDSIAQLDFLLALFRPWITTDEAAFLLDDCTEQHIRDLVDSGHLRAVNIASAADSARRELRIYRYTVEHRILRPKAPLTMVSPGEILPTQRPTILRREAAKWLGCTEQHISNLNLPGPRDRNSDTRHRIHRDALIEFLTLREINQ